MEETKKKEIRQATGAMHTVLDDLRELVVGQDDDKSNEIAIAISRIDCALQDAFCATFDSDDELDEYEEDEDSP